MMDARCRIKSSLSLPLRLRVTLYCLPELPAMWSQQVQCLTTYFHRTPSLPRLSLLLNGCSLGSSETNLLSQHVGWGLRLGESKLGHASCVRGASGSLSFPLHEPHQSLPSLSQTPAPITRPECAPSPQGLWTGVRVQVGGAAPS